MVSIDINLDLYNECLLCHEEINTEDVEEYDSDKFIIYTQPHSCKDIDIGAMCVDCGQRLDVLSNEEEDQNKYMLKVVPHSCKKVYIWSLINDGIIPILAINKEEAKLAAIKEFPHLEHEIYMTNPIVKEIN